MSGRKRALASSSPGSSPGGNGGKASRRKVSGTTKKASPKKEAKTPKVVTRAGDKASATQGVKTHTVSKRGREVIQSKQSKRGGFQPKASAVKSAVTLESSTTQGEEQGGEEGEASGTDTTETHTNLPTTGQQTAETGETQASGTDTTETQESPTTAGVEHEEGEGAAAEGEEEDTQPTEGDGETDTATPAVSPSTPQRTSARQAAQRAQRASTPAMRTVSFEGGGEQESSGSGSSGRRGRKAADKDVDVWITNEVARSGMVSRTLYLQTLARVLEAVVNSANVWRTPTEEQPSPYIPAPTGEGMVNPRAVHRLILLLLSLPKAYAEQARDARAGRADLSPAKRPAKEQQEEEDSEGPMAFYTQALKLLYNGDYTKVSRMLASKGIADLSEEEVRKALLKLYPRRGPCTPMEANSLNRAIVEGFEPEEVLRFLSSRRRGIAPGPSGLSYDDIKGVCAAYPIKGPQVIACFCSLIASGRLNTTNANTINILLDLNGVALKKDPNNITSVRPIGLTEALTNLTAGLLAAREKDSIKSASGSTQYGFGWASGTQLAGRKLAIQLAITQAATQDGAVVVMDGKNYYNCVNRDQAGRAVSEHPGLAPFFAPQLLPTAITYNNRSGAPLVIELQEGVNQGGGLSGPVSNMAAAPIISKVTLDHPSVAHAAYIDDNGVAGRPRAALAAMVQLRGGFKDQLGATMAHEEVYAPEGLSEEDKAAFEAEGFKVMEGGLVYAGTPIGDTEFLEAWVKERAEKVLDLLRVAEKMVGLKYREGGNLQIVFSWLRLCILPSFNFVLQVAPPRVTVPFARRIDEEVEEWVLRLAGGKAAVDGITGDEAGKLEIAHIKTLIHLPIDKGGLGLASQANTACAAFVGSFAATLERIVGPAEGGGLDISAPGDGEPLPGWLDDYVDALKILEDAYGKHVTKGFSPKDTWAKTVTSGQTTITRAINALIRKRVDEEVAQLPKSSLEGRVRVDAHKARQAPESGAWLTANPTRTHHDLHMDDFTFSLAIRQRLGIPVEEVKEGAKCHQCKQHLDRYGNHAHTCKALKGLRAGRAAQHQRTLRSVCRDAGATLCPGEPPVDVYLDRKPGGNPDEREKKNRFDVGVTLKGHPLHTKMELIDLTYVATTKQSRKVAYAEAGNTANDAELAKRQFYARTFQPLPGPAAPRVNVRGFAQETGGPLGKYAKELLYSLASQARPKGLPGQHPVDHRYRNYIELFSVLNQRCNAQAHLHFIRTCVHPGAPPPPPSAYHNQHIDEEEEEEEDTQQPPAPQSHSENQGGSE